MSDLFNEIVEPSQTADIKSTDENYKTILDLFRKNLLFDFVDETKKNELVEAINTLSDLEMENLRDALLFVYNKKSD